MNNTAPIDLNPFNSDHLALIGAACKAAGPETKSAFESMGRAILSKDWPPPASPHGWSPEIEKAFCDVMRCALANQTTESPIHDALDLLENALRAPKVAPGVLLSSEVAEGWKAIDARNAALSVLPLSREVAERAVDCALAEVEDWKAIEAYNAKRYAVEIVILGPFRDDGTLYYLRANECQVRGETRTEALSKAAAWCREEMSK